MSGSSEGQTDVTAAPNHGSAYCSCRVFSHGKGNSTGSSGSSGSDDVDVTEESVSWPLPPLSAVCLCLFPSMPRKIDMQQQQQKQQQAHGSSACFRWLAWSMV